MSKNRCAIVTVAFGPVVERLDYTFLSFAKNPQCDLHAFIIGHRLPSAQFAPIQYHLVAPTADFSHALREVYFRRYELIEAVEAEYAVIVDCHDVLCLQPLPDLSHLVGPAALGACVELSGGRYILGQGYTSSYLNAGVTYWNVAKSREMRARIVERGRSRFRNLVDDQICLNEVVQTCYYDQLRILPCQYNFRANCQVRQRGVPMVDHLDGVVVYHNSASMELAKNLAGTKPKADLPNLPRDAAPIRPLRQFWRRVKQRITPHVVK